MSNHKFVRDKESKAVLNTDAKKRNEIQAERQRARNQAQLSNRVSELEKQVAELQKIVLHGTKT